MKPDIGRESRFLPTAPALDALLAGSPSEFCHNFWCGKSRMVWLYGPVKKIEEMFICFDRIHERDRRTPHDDMGHAYA